MVSALPVQVSYDLPELLVVRSVTRLAMALEGLIYSI